MKSLLVSKNLRFDARLAVFHETERWLAVADLHYGYELSFRASGALFPAYGMQKIEARIAELLADYQPQTVVILGDLIHTAAAIRPFCEWIDGLRSHIPELILLRGNHDRSLKILPLFDSWRSGAHLFHHGDQPISPGENDVVLCGHLHPAETISDGAGFQKKLPALCQTATGWILPAFSPWAVGGHPTDIEIHGCWASTLKRVWDVRRKLATI